MKSPSAAVVFSLLLGASWRPCFAQTPPGELPRDPTLVNLDTPATLDKGLSATRLDVRVFGGDEGLTYASLGLHYGLGSGAEAIVRGSFAGRDRFALSSGGGAIRHGGTDVELVAKYRLPGSANIAGLVGVGLPVTPAQNDVYLTLGLAVAARLGNGSAVYLNPRAVFIEDNPIVGIGLGARLRIGDRMSLLGDYTAVVDGDNTRDTTTGARKRHDVYGIALRVTPPNRALVFDIGYTNGTGATTGFGLTPGLGGGSGALYVSLASRR